MYWYTIYQQTHLLAVIMTTSLFMRRRLSTMGFTLVEMMVVLAILIVLMTLAVPSVRNTLVESRTRSLVGDLQASIVSARSSAAQRAEPVVISPLVGTDWTTGWQISTAPFTGAPVVLYTREATEDPANKKVTIDTTLGTGFFNAAVPQIRFTAAGYSQKSDGAFLAGCVTFKNTSSNPQKQRLSLIASNAGRPRMCNPDATVGSKDYEAGCSTSCAAGT
jgi:prepilin-type N-terminal cleavage/methylation domain-containing protein